MTILSRPATHRGGSQHARARRRPPATTPFVSLHLLDGGAPDGALSGAARHAIEAHGALAAAQRLSITAPADLPRLYTQAEANLLVAALVAAGAEVAVVPARATA